MGELVWSDHKQMYVKGFYDRVAVSGKTLMLLSFVGAAQMAKAMRAALASPTSGKYAIMLDGERPEGIDKDNGIYCGEGYYCYAHRLPFGMVHAMFISRSPSLLMSPGDDALWNALKHPRYTTPLLKSWLPYLKEELEKERPGGLPKLFGCKTVACGCRMLSAMTKDLDDIVSAGLKDGDIKIAEDAA